jgi:O-methyltransferase involved in polyketide biosynthesis
MMTATIRGIHRQLHSRPWILDDALPLVGPAWSELHTMLSQVVREPVLRRAIAQIVARSRYAEDRLNDSFTQYVLLGAGLDSFAWRRPTC